MALRSDSLRAELSLTELAGVKTGLAIASAVLLSVLSLLLVGKTKAGEEESLDAADCVEGTSAGIAPS